MTTDLNTLALIFPSALLLVGLGFTVLIDPYIRREHRRIMLIIVVLCAALVVQNLWENALFVSRTGLLLKNYLSAFGYAVRPVILILFLYIVHPNSRKWPLWTLAEINAALYFSSPVTHLCFTFQESDYAMLRGPLWLTCPVISAVLLAYLLLRSVLRYRETKKIEQLIPVSVSLVIIASVLLDMSVVMEPQPISFLTIAIVAGSVFYYIWLHLQFVRAHERDLETAQRVKIMMTQIRPHFLFNALNTIRALYAKDPPLADKTLEGFSEYLRQNLDSLNGSELIPFSKELEHTRLYTDIETLRFPDIRMEYRIGDEDFPIPVLTVQPLVENAIRHGVRGREDGCVTVSAVREGDHHRITIEDNGAGFDPEKIGSFDETHIGLKNVKSRLEQLCGGTMQVRSSPGSGTCVTLLIPAAEQKQQKEKQE